jgi:tetratricopeptide (TPR) repeat protein
VSSAFGELSERGSDLLEQGDTVGALECFSRAERLATTDGEQRELCGMLGDMAVAFRRMGNDKAAIRTYGRAVELCRRHGDALNLSRWLSNLVALHTQSGELEAAERLLGELLQAATRTGRNDQIAIAVQSIGGVLLSRGRYQEAVEHLRAAVPTAASDPVVKEIVRSNLFIAQLGWGEALLSEGQPLAAISALRGALELLDANDPEELQMSIRARLFLTRLELQRGDRRAAMAELRAARDAASRIGDHALTTDLDREIANLGT